MLDGIGARYADVYDGFAALIGRAFGPFILLRTSGLPDVAGAEPAVRAMAAEMDALDTGPPGGRGPGLKGLVAEFRRWSGSDPVWLLSGAGQAGLWPTPELAAAYPAARPAAGPGLPATSLAPSTRGRGQGAAALEWLGAVILAGAGLGAYGWTGSILAGIVAFILLAVPVVWWLARRG